MNRSSISLFISLIALLIFSNAAEARQSQLHAGKAHAKTAVAALALPPQPLIVDDRPVVHDYRLPGQWAINEKPQMNGTIDPNNPMLMGACMGTIGPQGADATVVQGIMTAGTVRVNGLANLEAALNIAANLIEFVWFFIALCHLWKMFQNNSRFSQTRLISLANSLAFGALGVLTPAAINYLVASARDANLFN